MSVYCRDSLLFIILWYIIASYNDYNICYLGTMHAKCYEMERTVYQHGRVWCIGLQPPEVLFLRWTPKYGPKRTHIKFLKPNCWNLEALSRQCHHIPELGKCIKLVILSCYSAKWPS